MNTQLAGSDALVRRIQSGEDDLRELFIEDSIPFIKRVVRRMTHIYFVEQEDEFSIALEAFNQAISRYHAESQVPFEAYAQLLIKNRLLNWMRDQKKARQVHTMTDYEIKDGLDLADRLSDPRANQIQANLEFEESMVQLACSLQRFGLSMKKMTDKLPHHQDTRRLCIKAAKILTDDRDLHDALLSKCRLPCAALSHQCQIPLKTIEKNRASIIFFALLIDSEMDAIRHYLTAFEEGYI